MNYKLIGMFHKEVADSSVTERFAEINELAMKAGYLVEPEACTDDVEEFLKNESFNTNSTFYRTWEDITTKDRLALFADQAKHYMSTYGSDFSQGNGYVPNEGVDLIPYLSYKVIKAVGVDEVAADIQAMLDSGIAMKADTLDACIYFCMNGDVKLNVDTIANKEAQAIIANRMEIYPKESFSLLRCIMYHCTGSATLIKDRATWLKLRNEHGFTSQTFDFSKLDNEQLKALSTIFNRYKPIFLAMRGGENNKYLTKINHLSKKYHKPFKVGFWEDCLALHGRKAEDVIKEAKKKVDEISSFKKVSLMQAINERLFGHSMGGKMYIIRNGKVFFRENYQSPCDSSYLTELYVVLNDSLSASLVSKAKVVEVTPATEDSEEVRTERAKKIFIPKGIHYTCPTSEKNFMGNFPLGTAVDLGTKNTVVGIYWRNEWGTCDFDLHYDADDGNHYGFNGNYYDKDSNIVFSGDMTNAAPEATELLLFKKGCCDGVIKACEYSYRAIGLDSKLRLIVASEDIGNKISDFQNRKKNLGWGSWTEPVMLDPNNVILSAEIPCAGGKSSSMLGYVIDSDKEGGKLVLMDLDAGDIRVPKASPHVRDIVKEQVRNKVRSFVYIDDVLKQAGFEFVDDASEADIDFSDLKKDDLIKLFS